MYWGYTKGRMHDFSSGDKEAKLEGKASSLGEVSNGGLPGDLQEGIHMEFLSCPGKPPGSEAQQRTSL